MTAAQYDFASFLVAAADDARLRHVHVVLYAALWRAWQNSGHPGPMPIARRDIMHIAKINSRYTYNTAINDLHDYGYIRYEPSADPRVKSRVWLISAP